MTNRAYININGEYGLTHAGIDGWETAQQILDEMDRLGIWQTVLEFTGATNSLYRAKTLLKDIAALDCPKERIIPCFSLEPGLLLQTGAMDEMLRIIETHQPCCISLRPDSCSFTLKASESVLEKVSHLNPVVMIRFAQIKDKNKGVDDLVWLSERFPNMRFVVRRYTAGSWPFMFDLMRRTKNVYADTAFLLIRDSIELSCEHFGAERLLYGQPQRSGGGASMATIEYAQIPEEDKEKIRCRNFINLFSDPAHRQYLTENLRCVEDKVGNSLWRPFINRQGVMADVYDVHTHLGYTASYGYIRDLTFEDQVARFEQDMKQFNIKKIVSAVTGIADPVACHLEKEAAVKGKEDKLQGYVRYNPNYESLYTDEYLAERFATGYYVGLKTLPHYMGKPITDKSYERMFQYAHDHNMPILIHCGTGHGNPIACAQMAERYPNAKVVLGHSGLNAEGRAMCEQVAQDPKYSNVYFEFCASYLAYDRPWAESLKIIDYKRVLYGTDSPILSMIWELGRLLSEEIPDEQLKAILGENAKRIYGF